MPPERLSALKRQRALVAEHLAWLDRELASATAETPTSTDSLFPTSPPPPQTVEPAPLPAQSEAAPDTSAPEEAAARLASANARANAILEEYSTTGRFDPESTRRGCILLASAVLILGFVSLLVIYILRYR